MDGEGTRKGEVAAAIGARFAGVRRQIGMTQEATAKAAGLSAEEVSLIEQGDSEIAASTLIQLAGALGVPEAVLLVGLKWRPEKGAFEIADPPTHYIAEI